MARRSAQPTPVAGSYLIDQGELELLSDADISCRWLIRVNGTPQSYVDVEDPTYLEFDYIRQLAACVDVLAPQGPVTAVHLGGGGATLPRWLEATRPGSRQIVIENDAALVEVVRGQLGLPRAPAIRVRVGDAGDLVDGLSPGRADIVVHDIFSGGSTPPHVTSLEFFIRVRRAINAEGHLLVNVADGRGLSFARSQVATLRAVFGHVILLGPPGVLASRRFGNLVLLAGDNPLPVEGLRRSLSAEPLPVRVLDETATERFAAGTRPVTDATAVASPLIPV